MSNRILLSLAGARSLEEEDALADWYRAVHLPQVLGSVSALTSARAFRVSETGNDARAVPRQRFLTLYEIDDAVTSPSAVTAELAAAAAAGSFDLSRALDLNSIRQAIFDEL
jgi:hypothetical protein